MLIQYFIRKLYKKLLEIEWVTKTKKNKHQIVDLILIIKVYVVLLG